jgi:tetratricopeptide (TPR) repeat protein
MKPINIIIILFALAAYVNIRAQESTNAPSSRDQFSQYMTEWQNGWPDNATNLELAAKIIQIVATLNPKPAIPEEARHHFVKAQVFMQNAQQLSDYAQVISEYDEVGRLVPWLPNYWYNRATAREAQGQFTAAKKCLEMYLLTHPGELDARKVQDKFYALEAEQEKAEKDKVRSEAKARVERIAQAERDRLNSFEGQWRLSAHEVAGQSSDEWIGTKIWISKEGRLYSATGPDWFFIAAKWRLSGRSLTAAVNPTVDQLAEISQFPRNVLENAQNNVQISAKMSLSDDGQTIYAEEDGYTIYATSTTQFFVTSYAYSRAERKTGNFKYTFTRIK